MLAGEATAAQTHPGAAVQRQESADPAQPATVPAVTIETDQGTLSNLPVAQALAVLADKIDWCGNRIELEAGDHDATARLHSGAMGTWNEIGAAVSDVFGGFLSMPPLSIWDKPRADIAAARAAARAGDPVAAGAALRAAGESYQASREQYLTYKEGHFEGADNTITMLKAVILVDVAVGAAGTVLGGEATATVGASGLLTQAATAGVVGAEGAALKNTGEQAESGQPFNWTQLAVQTAGGFASGFLAALVSGPLKEMLAESCAGYVTEELMSDAELAELAETVGEEVLERGFLQSSLKRFVIDQVADHAGEWLMGKPIEMVTEELKKAGEEGRPPPSENRAVSVVAQLAAVPIAAAFKAALKAR